ncbi:MAG TPA: hypothetical protein VFK94_06135, partial [Patescibacteria group bacterium]|nr:hypothetical protein [Patescibacteria group bacterium]
SFCRKPPDLFLIHDLVQSFYIKPPELLSIYNPVLIFFRKPPLIFLDFTFRSSAVIVFSQIGPFSRR